jgi:hypothetical protein
MLFTPPFYVFCIIILQDVSHDQQKSQKSQKKCNTSEGERIKIPTKASPGPQGWFSWRTLEPDLSQPSSGDPMAVNSSGYSHEWQSNL